MKYVRIATIVHCTLKVRSFNVDKSLEFAMSRDCGTTVLCSLRNSSSVRWLGGRVVKTSDSRLAVKGSPPGHDTAWLFISETGDRLWWVNCLGNCNHHLDQLSLASLRGR